MKRGAWILVAVLFGVAGAGAQEREIQASGLPPEIVDRLIRIVHDPGTLHLEGGTFVPVDSVLPASLVVMGPLRLAGRVEGDVVVVGGDASLEPGFEVWGDITVVEGTLRGDDLGRIDGLALQFSRHRVTLGRRTGPDPGATVSLGRDRARGASSHMAVHAADFNRVEGLQVQIGPAFTSGGANPLRGSARLIWRTQGNGNHGVDRMGFEAGMEQLLGGRREWRVGGGVHSAVRPVEAWGLTDRENAWSSVLFQNDSRDHFQERGWRIFVRATPRALPLEGSLAFHRDEHRSLAAADPWALFTEDDGWRPQSLVAEGSTRSLVARATLDTRGEPGGGWFVQGVWRQGLGGNLAMPGSPVPAPGGAGPGPAHAPPELDARAAAAFLDLRRSVPVGGRARLNLRGVAGGAVEDRPLPPQFQRALGGAGSLPGHAPFAGDCGAREALVTSDPDGGGPGMFPFYGCDRIALFQAEYQGPLTLRLGFGPPDPDRAGARKGRADSKWVVFLNGGRGWSNGDWGDLPRADAPALHDAGLGLLLGDAGIYWALPIGQEGRGSRFHIRLERRF